MAPVPCTRKPAPRCVILKRECNRCEKNLMSCGGVVKDTTRIRWRVWYVIWSEMHYKTSFLDKSPIFCGQISHHFEDKYPTEMRTNLHRKWPFFRNYTYSIVNPRLPTHLPQNLSIANHYYCLFRRLRRQASNGKNFERYRELPLVTLIKNKPTTLRRS